MIHDFQFCFQSTQSASHSIHLASIISICDYVSSKPYLKVYGGDVLAGSGYGSTCSVNPAADVKAVAKYTGSAWIGAGSQLGVFANGAVNSFSSMFMRQPNNPEARVFANTPAMPSPNFGGNFGGNYCDDDFWAGKSDTTVASGGGTKTISSLASGQYYYTSSVTLNMPDGQNIDKRIAIYVDGDVYIDGNGTNAKIALATSGTPSWTSVSQLPAFMLVVRGNIYIDPTIDQLDGVYIALPSTTEANNGRIYTCSNNTPNPSSVLIANDCRDKKLSVNGMFAATRVNFLRTVGTLRKGVASEQSNSANIAETFTFLPDAYIAVPAASPKKGSSDRYDSILSLSPSL
jgi:hypothetical protein